MGFFDNIFRRGKAYTGKRNPMLACELSIEGERYLLEEFDMDFERGGSKRYVPFYAVFREKLSPELEAWITRSSQRKEVTVKFYRNIDEMQEGALFTVVLCEAACMRYRKTTRGDDPVTTLVLTARGIRIGDEAYGAEEWT